MITDSLSSPTDGNAFDLNTQLRGSTLSSSSRSQLSGPDGVGSFAAAAVQYKQPCSSCGGGPAPTYAPSTPAATLLPGQKQGISSRPPAGAPANPYAANMPPATATAYLPKIIS